jgi:hypothetical protein
MTDLKLPDDSGVWTPVPEDDPVWQAFQHAEHTGHSLTALDDDWVCRDCDWGRLAVPEAHDA